MNLFNITENSPVEIFVAETTWDLSWNPGVDYYKVTNYKDYMNTLKMIFEEKSAFTVLCKLGENYFGYTQDVHDENWGGNYEVMSSSFLDYWKDKIVNDKRTVCKVPQEA